MKETLEYIWQWLTNFYNFVGGVIMAFLGYLLPIKDVVNFMMFLFVLDVVFGYLKARKIDKEKFRVRLIWEKTIPRMLFSVIIIAVLFVWDNVHRQSFVESYNIAGWFISGLLIVSVLENMYKITGWTVLPFLSSFIKKKIDDKADLNEDCSAENEDYETK